jgi:hypothetical protein
VEPSSPVPCSRTPVGRLRLAMRTCQVAGSCCFRRLSPAGPAVGASFRTPVRCLAASRRVVAVPAVPEQRGLLTRSCYFGAQSHGLSDRCLRFAVRVAPFHARLASGWWPVLYRRVSLPLGLHSEVSTIVYMASSPPGFAWRNQVCSWRVPTGCLASRERGGVPRPRPCLLPRRRVA